MDKQSIYSGISIVLPAFNEEANIKHAVLEVADYLKNVTMASEIIVVDDGSADKTADIVAALAAADNKVRLVQHLPNKGYGASIAAGIKAASYDLVFFTDSDRQFDIKGLDIMLPLMNTGVVDIIVGYRLNRRDPYVRKFLSWGFNTLVGFLFDLQVKDIDCAFKLFKRDIFSTIKIESRNFFVNTEMLAKARRLGFEILEVGVGHFPRAAGRSSVSLKYVPITLKELWRIWKELKKMDRGSN